MGMGMGRGPLEMEEWVMGGEADARESDANADAADCRLAGLRGCIVSAHERQVNAKTSPSKNDETTAYRYNA